MAGCAFGVVAKVEVTCENVVKSAVVLVFRLEVLRSVSAPNTACTRLGVCAAFFRQLLGSRSVPSKWRYLVPPQAGNADRWAT